MIIKASDHLKSIYSLQKTGLEIRGHLTGLQPLDEDLEFKLATGRFMVLTGIPNMGKSEFLDALVLNMAIGHNWKTLYFSPENNPEDEHVVAHIERFTGKRLRDCTRAQIEQAVAYLDRMMSWTNPKDKSLDNILKIAKEKHAKDGLHILIIDPWNYVTLDRRNEMLHESLSISLNKITSFSRDNDILVIVVAHPKNLSPDKNGIIQPPSLYDISDGANWRNKCDYGVVVHRPDLSRNQLLVSVGKRKKKWMGKIGQTLLDYDIYSGRFKGKNELEFTLPNKIPPAF
jgi:twinkle protein